MKAQQRAGDHLYEQYGMKKIFYFLIKLNHCIIHKFFVYLSVTDRQIDRESSNSMTDNRNMGCTNFKITVENNKKLCIVL